MASTSPNNKFGKGKVSGLLLILFIFGLYVFQNEAVTPFVERVMESSVFDADTSELGGKDRSALALLQCNDFVRDELDSEHPLEFGDADFKAWELADGRYLVRSQVLEQNDEGQQVRKAFACNVQFTGGDDADHANWSLQGLEIQEL